MGGEIELKNFATGQDLNLTDVKLGKLKKGGIFSLFKSGPSQEAELNLADYVKYHSSYRGAMNVCWERRTWLSDKKIKTLLSNISLDTARQVFQIHETAKRELAGNPQLAKVVTAVESLLPALNKRLLHEFDTRRSYLRPLEKIDFITLKDKFKELYAKFIIDESKTENTTREHDRFLDFIGWQLAKNSCTQKEKQEIHDVVMNAIQEKYQPIVGDTPSLDDEKKEIRENVKALEKMTYFTLRHSTNLQDLFWDFQFKNAFNVGAKKMQLFCEYLTSNLDRFTEPQIHRIAATVRNWTDIRAKAVLYEKVWEKKKLTDISKIELFKDFAREFKNFVDGWYFVQYPTYPEINKARINEILESYLIGSQLGNITKEETKQINQLFAEYLTIKNVDFEKLKRQIGT